MEHPFINDLSDKSLEDLQTAISGLMSKVNFAYKTGNQPLISQLNMAINSYKAAYQKKMDEMIKKQNLLQQVNITKEK